MEAKQGSAISSKAKMLLPADVARTIGGYRLRFVQSLTKAVNFRPARPFSLPCVVHFPDGDL
jgi:hypothetical protein